MLVSEFDYHLPKSQIAQVPTKARDQSRLLVLPRRQDLITHRIFSEFPRLVGSNDLLVLNDTQVIPARLIGRKETGGKVEILLDRPLSPVWMEDGRHCQRWSCLLRASRRLRSGLRVFLPGGAELAGDGTSPESKQIRVLLRLPLPVDGYLNIHGKMPLPAYIRRAERDDGRTQMDQSRYQTVYARQPGAVAAPTAGLHFTPQTLEQMTSRGVRIVRITLHVGPGTFLPVRTDQVKQHRMHSERYHIGSEVVQAVVRARSAGHRVVAVGTTVVRALESAWNGSRLCEGEGETSLFIYPGFSFRVVDALLTNFHLPRSTLLMLVCAFGGQERVLSAYREAVKMGYRFYSYGDAMFLA